MVVRLTKDCNYSFTTRDFDGGWVFIDCAKPAAVTTVQRIESSQGRTFYSEYYCRDHARFAGEVGDRHEEPGLFESIVTVLAVG